MYNRSFIKKPNPIEKKIYGTVLRIKVWPILD